MQCSVLRGC